MSTPATGTCYVPRVRWHAAMMPLGRRPVHHVL